MLLGRLRIWGKLALLSVIPLLAMVALTVPTVLARVDQAQRAGETVRAARVAAEVGSLVQDLQQERLLAVGLLLGTVTRAEVTLQITSDTDRVMDIPKDIGADVSRAVSRAIGQVQNLGDLRRSVLSRSATAAQIMSGYGQVIAGVLQSLSLLGDVDTATAEGRQLVALDSLLTADEATAAEATALALLAYDKSQSSLALVAVNQALARSATDRAVGMATSTQLALRQLVDRAFTDRFGAQVETNPQGAIVGLSAEKIFPAIASFITLGNFVEKRIVADVITAVSQRRTTAITMAYVVGLGVTLVVVVVLLLGLTIGRAVAGPLGRLTMSAEYIAQVAENELVRVADDETEAAQPIRMDSLDIGGADEIGDLARAFSRVQSTASRLVERQVTSRRNIAEMFGHIGRRTHNLVSRQVAMIDGLEREEADPGRLRHLYRLDHISNRLLRNANSLVALSGAEQVDEHMAPVPLGDVVRLALGEIEDFERVDARIPDGVALTPGVVADLTLVIAELMENAALFSAPTTRVVVTADRMPQGVRLAIIDQGIGMSEARMAEENGRLTRRERLDLAPTQVLGLFVVGRLARRHRMTVTLMPTRGGGVTVVVDLGEHLLAVDRALGTPLAVARLSSARPAPEQLPPVAQRLSLPAGVGRMVRRADELLASAGSWNAFAVVRGPQQPQDIAPQPPPAVPEPPLFSPSGLRRRVPGTHHPAGPLVVPRLAQPPAEADAAAVRDLVDQFALGVARAIDDFGADR